MADSAAEMCAEFSQNFTALEMKYGALQQQLLNEKELTTALQRQLDAAQKETQHKVEENQRLLKELEDMAQFKDRYFATSMAMEHLKGRLESARKGITDRDLEHQHEVEQLRAQIADLMKRVEMNTDLPLLNSVRSQKVEIEERCALVTGQLLEEKERCNQQSIVTNSVLRDLQSRNTEYEQRCRALDVEITQLRAEIRRGADAHTEALLEKERVVLENSKLAMTIESLQSDLQAVKHGLEDRKASHAKQMQLQQREWDRERAGMVLQVQTANARLEEALAQRAAEGEKLLATHRAASAKIASAREEALAEAEAARNAERASIDVVHRQKWQLAQLSSENENLRKELEHEQSRAADVDAQKHRLQVQLESATQAEAWSHAEKDRLQAQLSRQEQQLEAASASVKALEAIQIEHERVKLQLEFSQANAVENQRQIESEAFKLRNVEEAYKAKLAVVANQLKELKRSSKEQLQRAELHRKKLIAALHEKERDIVLMANRSRLGGASAALGNISVGEQQQHHSVAAGEGGATPQRAVVDEMDPLRMMQRQIDEMQASQDRIRKMHHATSGSDSSPKSS